MERGVNIGGVIENFAFFEGAVLSLGCCKWGAMATTPGMARTGNL